MFVAIITNHFFKKYRIELLPGEILIHVEVIHMKQSKTNAQKVRQQNQASSQGMSQEFASETDAQQVRQQNQQSAQKKNQQQ